MGARGACRRTADDETRSGSAWGGFAADPPSTARVSLAMSARALGVIVTGGRHHVVSVEDLAFLERILRALGAKEIHTAGSDGVAAQVKAGARTRGIAVRRVTAKWMHDGPANAGERTITLAGVARTVIAFPDEAATEDLLTRARKRRLRIIRKVRADRWLTGRRWIGGSSPCQADRTSGAEFPPNLMNWHRGFNGRIETTAISAGLAPRDYFGDTAHDRPDIVESKFTLHSAIDDGAGVRGSWQVSASSGPGTTTACSRRLAGLA